MGGIPSGPGSPFSSMDQKAAYGAFKSSGSFDPDALYSQKESMVAPYKNLKRLASAGAIVGVLAGAACIFISICCAGEDGFSFSVTIKAAIS